ncbi:MAG: class I SAM-dependent methyltransferase [Candidatus Dormibacteria bacterium]
MTLISHVPHDPPRDSFPGSLVDRFFRRIALAAAKHLSGGRIELHDNGEKWNFGSGKLHAKVSINDIRTYSAVLRNGSNGFALGYINGWWDCDDLTSLVRILLRSQEPLTRIRDAAHRNMAWPIDLFTKHLQRSREQRREDVHAHYDLGNVFFEAMLDPTMSYSCALFTRPEMTLEEASLEKLRTLCEKLELHKEDHLIEIGSGWGGLAEYAARTYGCRVTTTTISEEQFAYTKARILKAGLSNLVTVLNEDFKELKGTYDKLVSVEMIEALDWQQFPAFFAKCGELLSPQGLALIQAITIEDRSYDRARHSKDFIKRYIFPGGCLPSVGALLSAVAETTDMHLVQLTDIGMNYAETLRSWQANVDRHQSLLQAIGLDDNFFRMWRCYLSYCEGAFLERHVSDVQVLLAKPHALNPASGRAAFSPIHAAQLQNFNL